MDPNFSGVWSASEIDTVKSFIASHNTTKTYTDDPNEKHNDIVDELQARFPGKDKDHVVQLYVHLVVEMNTPIPKKKRQHPAMAWTHDEHKNFLRGLEVYGRGNWKNISRYFVPTRTPNQICSHAQKYFQRKECTTRKQRFSINDVSLNDTDEPWVQKNSSGSKCLTIGHSAYNTDSYDIEGQHVVFNKLTHASQESSTHPSTWTRGQHIVASSALDPTMVQSNSLGWEALAFTSGSNNTNYYDFNGQHNDMNNLACADLTSNNHVATWTRDQQSTSSFVAPTTVQNPSPSWEVLSFNGSGAYNTNYYDFNGQASLNNITNVQPW